MVTPATGPARGCPEGLRARPGRASGLAAAGTRDTCRHGPRTPRSAMPSGPSSGSAPGSSGRSSGSAPGSSGRRGERGLTLIELMVSIAILVLMAGVAILGISSIRGADVSTTANVLSGAMRYVSSLAVSFNRTHRLVIDMDGARYWTEVANEDDPCSRFLPEDADPPSPEDAAKQAAAGASEGGAEGEPAPPPPAFEEERAELLSGAFQPDTNVTAVLTAHHETAQSSGKVAIYFYPTGYTERAMLWVGERLEDERGEGRWEPALTLELSALGRITRHPRPLDVRSADQLDREAL
jgi:prepilin-type N-terminal cleavage/methylation domain-containing protein